MNKNFKKIKLEIQDFVDNIESYSDEIIFEYAKSLTEDLNCEYADLKNKILTFAVHNIKDKNLKIDFIVEFFNNLDDIITITEILFPEEERINVFNKIYQDFKFEKTKDLIPFPNNLKFGIELEYCTLSYNDILSLYETKMIGQIMQALKISEDTINSIIKNSDFKKENEFHKWIFSTEGSEFAPEIASPIMTNNLDSLNQLKAMCILFKSLKATTNDATGLHINIDANFFENNENALKNLLIIWSECEEIFFKIANDKNDQIRIVARYMAMPIKENIQKSLEEKEEFKLNNEEDITKFIYNIQGRNRLDSLVNGCDDIQLDSNKNGYDNFKEYMDKKDPEDCKIKYTSINFNHLACNKEDKGRIEFRLFNSTLSYDCLIQNLSLIGNLCNTSLLLAKDPTYKQDIVNDFLRHDISEEQKLDLLLDLLFDEKNEKQIFKDRWLSVKDLPSYELFNTGEETFIRENSKIKSL